MMAEMPSSPLPPDPEYWNALAERIRKDASGPLATFAAAHADVWYGVLARRAPWLVAASAAAMVMLWLSLPATDPSVAVRFMERSLEPDEFAGTMMGGPEAPSVDTLMVQFAPALEERR